MTTSETSPEQGPYTYREGQWGDGIPTYHVGYEFDLETEDGVKHCWSTVVHMPSEAAAASFAKTLNDNLREERDRGAQEEAPQEEESPWGA